MATNYAVRIIVELTKRKKLSSVQLSMIIGIPETSVMKVLSSLKKANLIVSQQGNDGGFMLSKSPQDIRLYDVIAVMEPSMRINRCLEEDEYCSRCAIETCNIRYFYHTIQKEINREFMKYTIDELIQKK